MRHSLTTLLAASGTDSLARSESPARAAPGLTRVAVVAEEEPVASGSPCRRQPCGDEAELEDGRWGQGCGTGRGGARLWSLLLGRLRLEDRLSPGALGCGALCLSGVRTKFGINIVTSWERGATRLPKDTIAGAPGGETEDMDFLSGLELVDLLDPWQPDWPLEPGLLTLGRART